MGATTSISPIFIDVGGILTEIRIQGNGRTILFLHPEIGFEGARPVIDGLAALGRVIAPSHPGFGRSQLPADMTSVDDLSYFYLDLIESFNFRDIVLVGCSFGGWLAAEIATKGSERIAALVLCGATGIRTKMREERDFADIFGLTRPEVNAISFADPAHAPPPPDQLSDEELEGIARDRESLALFAWSPYFHNPKLRGRLHRIAVPTLVLWGEQDQLAAPAYGRAFAEAIPEARFAAIADAGHYPHIEQADRFVAEIAAFLAALDPAPRN